MACVGLYEIFNCDRVEFEKCVAISIGLLKYKAATAVEIIVTKSKRPLCKTIASFSS